MAPAAGPPQPETRIAASATHDAALFISRAILSGHSSNNLLSCSTITKSAASHKKRDKRPAGAIRNVLIRDVIAHAAGMSVINGHPYNPLEGVTFENVKLFMAHDARAPYDKAEFALKFMLDKNLKLRNVEVQWQAPAYDQWRSALFFEDIQGLEVDHFSGRQAKLDLTSV
jgi:hypothetical protein